MKDKLLGWLFWISCSMFILYPLTIYLLAIFLTNFTVLLALSGEVVWWLICVGTYDYGYKLMEGRDRRG